MHILLIYLIIDNTITPIMCHKVCDIIVFSCMITFISRYLLLFGKSYNILFRPTDWSCDFQDSACGMEESDWKRTCKQSFDETGNCRVTFMTIIDYAMIWYDII